MYPFFQSCHISIFFFLVFLLPRKITKQFLRSMFFFYVFFMLMFYATFLIHCNRGIVRYKSVYSIRQLTCFNTIGQLDGRKRIFFFTFPFYVLIKTYLPMFFSYAAVFCLRIQLPELCTLVAFCNVFNCDDIQLKDFLCRMVGEGHTIFHDCNI